MARFEVFADPDGTLLLDVQTDLLTEVGTRLVVPLLPADAVPPAIRRLHPIFTVNAHQRVMATHLMAAYPSRLLRTPIKKLSEHQDTISAALNMIFLGF